MKRRKNTRPKKQSKNFFNSKGTITFKILIGIVIAGSIALVSGIFPEGQISPINPDAPKYKPVAEDGSIKKESLQLKTIKFEACSKTVAIEMVLDRSGSMGDAPEKMPNLKTASSFFLTKLTDDAPVGLITFATDVREEYPIQPYNDIKSQLSSTIQSLSPNGATNTRGVLARAKTALEVGINKFPGRQFTLIFVTDGVPTIGNPLNPLAPPNVADEIKNLGVKIYSIGITQAVQDRPSMVALMTSISSPGGFFEAPDTTTLDEIFNKIGFEICQTAS